MILNTNYEAVLGFLAKNVARDTADERYSYHGHLAVPAGTLCRRLALAAVEPYLIQ